MKFKRCVLSVSPLVLACIVLGLVSNASMADEADDWSLGRVFMTRAERLQLDKLRDTLQTTDLVVSKSNDPAIVNTVSDQRRNPSGYILSSNGSPYRWKDGDFRKSSRQDLDDDSKDRGFEIVKHLRKPIVDKASELPDADPTDAEQTSDDNSEH